MKKGLNLIGDLSTNSQDGRKQHTGILSLDRRGKMDLASSIF
ncbi:MAG: hypothetical protein ACXWFC_14215 [Nitrososphaeraceae archaeon]